jgi:hypothetical protein
MYVNAIRRECGTGQALATASIASVEKGGFETVAAQPPQPPNPTDFEKRWLRKAR